MDRRYVDTILRYIAVFVFLLALFVLLSGCAELRQHLKDADELYNTPYYKGEDKQRPEEVAGYYESNFPDTSANDKATMLYEKLKKDGWNVNITEQRVKVTRKIVSYDGKRVWPTTATTNKEYTWEGFQLDMEKREKIVRELESKLNRMGMGE